ncbi:MAG: RDD family protein, partial [Clostridiales bacterium]|nr:RDD family protein [Clostridiales bacterium]
MNYITITTPDNIEIEYRLAGAGSRLGASVVDFLMQILAIAALVLTIFFTAFQGETSNLDNLDDAGWIVGIALLAIFLIFYGYYIFAEVYMNGQTVGKKIYGLRVIKENGQPINFSQSLIRNILKLTLDFTGVGVIMIMFSKKCKRLGDMAASTIVVALDPNRINLSAVSLAQMLSAEK